MARADDELSLNFHDLDTSFSNPSISEVIIAMECTLLPQRCLYRTYGYLDDHTAINPT